jgi:UDP-glucose 4-epimerase
MGFIGLHTVRAFLDAGEDVVATYHETWRPPSFLKDEMGKRVIYEQADIGEPNVLLGLVKKYKIDGVVHLAIHGKAYPDPGDDLRANMDKLSVVLDAVREAEVRRLCMASSSAPYFGLSEGPFKETDFLPMTSIASPEAFKKAWEILSMNYAVQSGIDLVTMRLSGVYGPMYASMFNLPSRLCHAAAKGIGPDFSAGVPFSEDANDMTFVKDIALGIRLVHQAPKLEHKLYNIGTGKATSNGEFLAAVTKAKPDFDVTIREGKGPRYRPNARLDISRATDELGFKPVYTCETAVAEYIDWLEQGNAV